MSPLVVLPADFVVRPVVFNSYCKSTVREYCLDLAPIHQCLCVFGYIEQRTDWFKACKWLFWLLCFYKEPNLLTLSKSKQFVLTLTKNISFDNQISMLFFHNVKKLSNWRCYILALNWTQKNLKLRICQISHDKIKEY